MRSSVGTNVRPPVVVQALAALVLAVVVGMHVYSRVDAGAYLQLVVETLLVTLVAVAAALLMVMLGRGGRIVG